MGSEGGGYVQSAVRVPLCDQNHYRMFVVVDCIVLVTLRITINEFPFQNRIGPTQYSKEITIFEILGEDSFWKTFYYQTSANV